jgi:hypothetical protein
MWLNLPTLITLNYHKLFYIILKILEVLFIIC